MMEAVVKQATTKQAPVVGSLRCQHGSRSVEEELMVRKQAHAHEGARRRSFHLSI